MYKAFHPDILIFSVLIAVNMGIAAYALYSRSRHKSQSGNWTEAVKHLGLISLALGIFMTLLELQSALANLEDTTRELPANKIAGGLRSTLFSTLYGLAVYLVSLVVYSLLRLTQKRTAMNRSTTSTKSEDATK